MFHGLMNNPVY